MSYILDALRRADAERLRGAVPGLHDQPDLTALADPGRDGRSMDRARRPLAVGAGLGLAALGLAALGWWALGPGLKGAAAPPASGLPAPAAAVAPPVAPVAVEALTAAGSANPPATSPTPASASGLSTAATGTLEALAAN